MAEAVRDSGRREAILEAATALFLDVGYGAASMDALVRSVGGSKSTIYAHFRNKEALFAAAVAALLRDLTDSVAMDLRGVGLHDALMRIGERLLRVVLSDRHIGLARLVVAEARRFPEVGRIYQQLGPERAARWIAAFFHSRQKSGEMPLADPREAADWFTARLLHRAYIERLAIDDARLDEAMMEQTVRAAVRGLERLYGIA